MVVLGERAVSYERDTPVQSRSSLGNRVCVVETFCVVPSRLGSGVRSATNTLFEIFPRSALASTFQKLLERRRYCTRIVLPKRSASLTEVPQPHDEIQVSS